MSHPQRMHMPVLGPACPFFTLSSEFGQPVPSTIRLLGPSERVYRLIQKFEEKRMTLLQYSQAPMQGHPLFSKVLPIVQPYLMDTPINDTSVAHALPLVHRTLLCSLEALYLQFAQKMRAQKQALIQSRSEIEQKVICLIERQNQLQHDEQALLLHIRSLHLQVCAPSSNEERQEKPASIHTLQQRKKRIASDLSQLKRELASRSKEKDELNQKIDTIQRVITEHVQKKNEAHEQRQRIDLELSHCELIDPHCEQEEKEEQNALFFLQRCRENQQRQIENHQRQIDRLAKQIEDLMKRRPRP